MARPNHHIAVIPARAGSVGYPKKNQLFFEATAEFVDRTAWFSRVLVSTNDRVVAGYANQHAYEVDDRPEHLCGADVSIKAVFEHIVPTMGIDDDDILWLFYLPVLYKNAEDFEAARRAIERPEIRSACSFTPVKVHPYHCWRHDEAAGKMEQYIANDVYRRQDMPAAWRHYHYTACFKAGELSRLNSELLNEDTHPLFLDEETERKLIEVDTPEDYDRWRAQLNEANTP